MISFETLFVEIGPVDLEIFDFAVFSETRVVKNVFLRLRKKVLGAHHITIQILIPLIRGFHMSYKRAL